MPIYRCYYKNRFLSGPPIIYFYIGATCYNFVIFNTFLAENLAEFGSCRLFYAKRECPNFLIYNMDIHVLTKFQLKTTRFQCNRLYRFWRIELRAFLYKKNFIRKSRLRIVKKNEQFKIIEDTAIN